MILIDDMLSRNINLIDNEPFFTWALKAQPDDPVLSGIDTESDDYGLASADLLELES